MWSDVEFVWKNFEEDLLTKDNLWTSLCFVFYLSLDTTVLWRMVQTHERSQKEMRRVCDNYGYVCLLSFYQNVILFI